MVTQADLTGDLRSVLGPDGVLPSESCPEFVVDGVTPRAVVAPGSYEQVAAAMRYAHEQGLAVIPWGGGALMHIGNVPRSYDIALSLSRLNQIIEHEPGDMTVTCQSGTTVAELNRQLRESGQMVPFSLNPTDPTTVGGLLATNESELCLGYGMPRDFTIGMRVVTAEGRLTRAGGKVVKNVAGYDLCKLYIGSLGTLGVIVEATFKVAPLPQAQERIELAFLSPQHACDFAAKLHRRGLSLLSLDIRRPMLPGESTYQPTGPYVLSADLAGTRAGVERSRRETRELARQDRVQPFDVNSPAKSAHEIPAWATREEPLTCIVSVLPTHVPAAIEAVDEAAPGAFISASPTGGSVVATWLGAEQQEGLVSRLRELTARVGGTLVVRGCSDALKRRIDVFGQPPPSFELMRRVKEQFDPAGVLSPGRFLDRL